MPKCPDKINLVPTYNLFSINFPVNMSGSATTNINYQTKAISLSSPKFSYDIPQMNISNNGINDPKSKHWPLIETWKIKKITVKKKIFGQTVPIPIQIPIATQTFYEIYILKKSAKITFFTIPSFKFQMNTTSNHKVNVNCNFTLSVEKSGGSLLAASTAESINEFYKLFHNSNIDIQTMSTTDRSNYINNMLSDPNFLATSFAATSTLILAYILRDGLTLNFTVLKALVTTLNWTVNSFYIEFGDLNINIPSFQLSLDQVPGFKSPFDVLKDPITGQEHPVTVSGSQSDGLTVTIQLLSIPNLDFFSLLITCLQNTLKLATDGAGNALPGYTQSYIQDLQSTLTLLNDAEQSVTKWIQKYLGITCGLIFSFVFCPGGMSNVPPTPFYLKVQLNLTINPYKILDDLFDAAKLIENEMTKFENNFIKDLGPITPKNFHSLDNTLKSALNIVNKELKDATDSSQKLIDNKYLNKVYPVAISAFIPIAPGE
jgi:hypothetical protein